MPPHPQTILPVRKKPYDRPQASAAGTSGATEPKEKKREKKDKKEKKRVKEAAAAAAAAAASAALAPAAASTAMVVASTSPEKRKRDKKNKASSSATPPAGGTGTKSSGSLSQPQSLQTGAASSPSPRRAHKNLSHAHTHPHTPLTPASADPNVKPPSARVTSVADSEKEALVAKNRALVVERELLRAREEAKKRELIRQQLAEAQGEVERLKKAEEEARGREEALKKKLEEMEVKVMEGEAVKNAQETVIHGHENTRRDLKEALSCGVCFEIYNDPHILSCGHLACRDCLSQWFRTPGAYVTEPLDPITPTTDLSHRTKTCHLCRAVVLRRPARAFFLRHILEPLGLHTSGGDVSMTPSPSKDAPGTASDPWRLLFPVEPSTYKLWDENDAVHRCPTCTEEIEDGRCYHCQYEFSEEENSGDEEGLFDDEGEDESGDEEGSEDAGEGAGPGQDPYLAQNVLADAMPHVFPGPYPPGLHAVMDRLIAGIANNVDGDDDDYSDDDRESSSRFGSDASDLDRSEDDYGGSFIDDGPNGDRSDYGSDDEYGDEHDSGDEGPGHRGGTPPRIRSFSTESDSAADHANAGGTSESEVDAGAGSDSASASGSASRAGSALNAEDDADDVPIITGARPRRRGRIVVLSDEDED
ncbi:hypothetical protein IAT38_008421 [Cryptococcus sp. DSM 104549]